MLDLPKLHSMLCMLCHAYKAKALTHDGRVLGDQIALDFCPQSLHLSCRQYKSHVRLHFVTNLGVAGGLVLLQSFGAGRYTVDRLMQKKGE